MRDRLIMGTILQTNWPVIYKNINILKVKIEEQFQTNVV